MTQPATSLLLCLVLLLLASARPAAAYSVLTHEQLIDLTWQTSIRPLLLSRYPGLTEAQLRQAHAYAYGGCAIQDIGYYPFGNGFFSNLTHYVRSGDFVTALFQNAHNANELAFAVGALSHYVGDTVGHPRATNLAVPVEFPSLLKKYGPVVSYAEGERQHVQTEFAFDIDEIARQRFAPHAYLKHIGLAVPTHQLAVAYYETYGLGREYTSRRRRVTLRGYRFAVRTLIPAVASAEVLLHRRSFPADTSGPDLDRLQQQLAQADFANGWGHDRAKPSLGTYSLAGLIYILPKFGPLRSLAIKGPDAATEDDYVRSVNLAVAELDRQIVRMGSASQELPNRDLDTGARVRPGGYRLTDDTYAELLRDIVRTPSQSIPAALKQDIEDYYADPSAPIVTRKNPKRWAQVQTELKQLTNMRTTLAPPHVPPDEPSMAAPQP